MRKIIVLALVAALAAGAIAPATAKKKKKKKPVPVELQFFLRMDADCAAPFLSLTDGEDGDCVYGDGGLNDVYQQTGLLETAMSYVAADGLPFTLDPTRHLTGSIALRGWNGAGAGPAEVDMVLTGTIAGEDVELATYTEAYTAGPQETKVITLDLELKPELAGAIVEGLTLYVYSHGTTLGGRGVEHDEPISFIKVPALK